MTNIEKIKLEVLENRIEKLEAFQKEIEPQKKIDGCEGCKYSDRDEFDDPCRMCRNSKVLYWRAKHE